MAIRSILCAFFLFMVCCFAAGFYSQEPQTETPEEILENSWLHKLATNMAHSATGTRLRAPALPTDDYRLVDGQWSNADTAEPMELPFQSTDSVRILDAR